MLSMNYFTTIRREFNTFINKMHIQSNNERSAFYDVTWSFIKFLLNIVCLQISSLPKFIGQIPPK